MTENALAIIEKKNVAQYFMANGLDPILEKIRQEVTGIVLDISTDKGRKEIASLAYKVAKSKTALDDMGKELVSGIKEQAKAIDSERRRAWDALEAMQKEVRAPLTEWEKREKERIAGHEAALTEIETAGRLMRENWQTGSLEAMQNKIKELLDDKRGWQEFTARAEWVKEQAITEIAAGIQKRFAYDAEQAELARLRQEEAARQQREHEERLQAQAAAKAKAEAEAKAKAEAEAEAVRVRAEQEKAEQERRRIQQEKEEAEARAEKAEEDRLAAIAQAEAQAKQAEAARLAALEKAEADRKAAEEKAKRDADLAAQRERDRIEAERKAEAEAAARREADVAHRAKINNEVLAALVKTGLTEEAGKLVIKAMATGKIKHVRIEY